jgi:hypothetical protein
VTENQPAHHQPKDQNNLKQDTDVMAGPGKEPLSNIYGNEFSHENIR